MASGQILVDLTNYKDKFGQRVAEDDYLVVVEDAEMDKSKAGNTMVNLWLRIVAPGSEWDGATLVDRLVLSEKSLFRVVAFLSAIGVPTPRKRLAIQLAQIIGKRLVVTVADGDPYNGNIRSEVRAYAKYAGGSRSEESDIPETSDAEDLEDAPEDDTEEQPETPQPAKKAAAKPAPVVEVMEDEAEELDLESIEL